MQRKVLLWWLCLYASTAAAQSLRETTILSAIDLAQFHIDTLRTALECTISLPKTRLPYEEREQGALLQLEFSLAAYQGDSLCQRTTTKLSAVEPTLPQSGQLLALSRLVLPAGSYRIVISLKNLGKRLFQVQTERTVEIRTMKLNEPALSDIRLGISAVQSKNKNAVLYRHGYEVVPNPEAVFSAELSTMVVYAEAYNLPSIQSLAPLFQQVYLMRNSQVLYGTEHITPLDAKDALHVMVETVDVSRLASGGYECVIAVLDSAKVPVLQRSKKFFVFNPAVKAAALPVQRQGTDENFQWLTEQEAHEMRQQLAPIMRPEEASEFERLQSLDAKRQFFQKFWASRGGTSAQRAYMNQLVEADRLYATRTRKGYETDRGRIFLKYGRANSVQSVPGSQQTRAYEIWFYDNLPNQGEAMFVFVERTAGNYELVHATVRDEVQNPNWRAMLTMPAR